MIQAFANKLSIKFYLKPKFGMRRQTQSSHKKGMCAIYSLAYNCYNTSTWTWNCHHKTRATGKTGMTWSVVNCWQSVCGVGCVGRNQFSVTEFYWVLWILAAVKEMFGIIRYVYASFVCVCVCVSCTSCKPVNVHVPLAKKLKVVYN